MKTPNDTSQTNEDQPHGLDTRVAVMTASLAIGVLIGLAAIGFLEVVRWAIALWDLTIPLDLSL